jgi:hypothetical protein
LELEKAAWRLGVLAFQSSRHSDSGSKVLRRAIFLAAAMAAAIGTQTAAHVAQQRTPEPWPGFEVIMWHEKTARQYEALRAAGVTAAKVAANRASETAASATQKAFPIARAGLGLYIENIATDFYSAYHRWTQNKHENWRFLELKKALAENPSDKGVFIREPSLSDPAALAPIEARLTEMVRDYGPYRPLFFNLGDEPGIADLSAAWDFDLSKPSLRAMRVWLRSRYGTLAALNQEWATRFRRWDDVVPSTTTAAMARGDDNFASWSDFKEWMDVAFADAIRRGTSTVHQSASWARAGIEGVQLPGWGGYDYSRLAGTVDVIELYDLGRDIEILRSFNPKLILLTTPGWNRPGDGHILWSEFLRGIRSMEIWDPRDDFLAPDGTPGAEGRDARAFFAAMHKGVGPLLMSATRPFDPIAILYSQASLRVRWMLDQRASGADWTKRSAGTENEDNAVRAAQRRALSLAEQLGFSPRFVSDDQIAHGILRKEHYQVAMLPEALALSPGAARALAGFVHAGGALIADGDVGLFDDHGRRLSHPLLSGALASGDNRIAHLRGDDKADLPILARLIHSRGLAPDVTVSKESGEPVADVKQYIFQKKNVGFVALLADSAPDGADRKVPVTVTLRHGTFEFDETSGMPVAPSPTQKVDVRSDTPTVFRFSPAHS